MKRLQYLKVALVGGASMVALTHPAAAKLFNIPGGDLSAALSAYMQQSGVDIVYVGDTVRGHHSGGAKGDYTETAALSQILSGTGFTTKSMSSDAIGIVPAPSAPAPVRVAQANKPAAAPPQQSSLETVVVTAQKKTENIQTVPIAVTALSQQQLTERQIAGGPDLVKEVPNLTFSKTNFSGYNLEIRGIGTQAISVTTDPAVAVAFNGTPFIRNHFFEQEFYDLDDVEVLRGPQGTLFGRNATAGVVNIKSALPTDSYEAMLSADIGNYSNRRYEAMLNLPIVGDTLDIRFAGEWTKRDGYSFNSYNNTSIDGRDLWSGRMTIGWKPISNLQTYFVWEHFQEDDDRLRSGKQLCKTDYGPGGAPGQGYNVINGVQEPFGSNYFFNENGDYFIQGCVPTSLYSPDAFEAPLGFALPYVTGLNLGNPYNGVTQSPNLRVINSSLNPSYIAKNDTLEFNADYKLTPALTLTSQTGYNHDYLWSTEDFNRFGSVPGVFNPPYCDPQLGCSDRLIAEDLSNERAWQLSQEFRLASNFSGPLNFSAGANYLHYETFEDYYVFINTISAGVAGATSPPEYYYPNPNENNLLFGGYQDQGPLGNLQGTGHNYFLNQNPYVLNSYAAFGEIYYNITNDLKFTGGIRFTEDQKHFLTIPSWIAVAGYGYPVTGVINQEWDRPTGRAVADWTPKLDFTDQTLVYASYAHGYKAGGANPPGTALSSQSAEYDPVDPRTFKPEYIEAFELGTKNTLLDNALTVNGDIFYYNYTGYQISEIVDRTAINNNYNAHVEGAELETNWEPLPGLKFAFAGGYENTGLAGGSEAVDLMDRTAGHPGWYVLKPFATQASDCIFPGYVAQYIDHGGGSQPGPGACEIAYQAHLDPFTNLPYQANPSICANPGGCPLNDPGFDPLAGTPGDPYTGQNTGQLCVQNCNGTGTPVYQPYDYGPVPNNGEGFSKNLHGNQLPNAPHFTTSLSTEYTMPVSEDWAATLHADFYWQSQSWWRVFNDSNYDKLHGYSNINLSLILTSANGWQVMAYVKNVFDVTAITGAFLNSDDTGLTTNVFLTDPRLFGVRVTKQLDQNDGFWGSDFSGYEFFTGLFSDTDNGKPPLWIELGGAFSQLQDGQQTFAPPFFSLIANPPSAPLEKPLSLGPLVAFEHPPRSSIDYNAKITFAPDDTDWVFTAAVRYGRTARYNHGHQQTNPAPVPITFGGFHVTGYPQPRYLDAFVSSNEKHAIFDFAAGKDIGLGMFGMSGSSNVSGGLRFVQFDQASRFSIHADPDYVFNKFGPKYNHSYAAQEQTKRSFHGVGPSLSWNGTTPVADSTDTSGIGFDWGVNGAVLFGRQIARVHHQTTGVYKCRPAVNGGCHITGTPIGGASLGRYYQTRYQRGPLNANRSRMVRVPNIGAFAGVSWRYQNAKVSFGYRADEFFGAMDGGIDTRKSENVGFFGPYANISIGLGG